MSCGAFKDKTVFVVGDVSSEFICSLAEKDGIRVFHHLIFAGEIATAEGDSYKISEADLTDRYYFQAIFLQYDFPMIIVDEKIDDDMLSTVALEQWEGEYQNRKYLWRGDKMFGETLFEDGKISRKILSEQEWQKKVDDV